MDLIIKASDLQKAASVVLPTVGSQTTMPILTNVLLTAGESNLTLTANDLESYVRCTVPTHKLNEGGLATIPADVLGRMVRELPAESFVAIRSEELNLVIEVRADESSKANSTFRLTGMPPEDFPGWPQVDEATKFELPQRVFRQMVERTVFAVAANDPRRVFLGELLELKGTRLRLVASDGKKLAYNETNLGEVSGPNETSGVLPAKALQDLCKSLGNEGVLRVAMGETQVAFEIEGTGSRILFVTKKIEGRFPNYEGVIPKDLPHNVVANADALSRLLRRAAIVTDDKAGAPVVLTVQPNLLSINVTTFDLGAFEGSLPVQYDGPKIEIGFNVKYVIETLKLITTADVVIKLNKPTTPALFLPPDATDLLYLIMPLKLADIRPAAPAEE